MAIHLLACADPENYTDQLIETKDGQEFPIKVYQPPAKISAFYDLLEQTFIETANSSNENVFKMQASRALTDQDIATPEFIDQAACLAKNSAPDDTDDAFRFFEVQCATLVLRCNNADIHNKYSIWATETLAQVSLKTLNCFGLNNISLEYNEPAMAFLGLSYNVKSPIQKGELQKLFQIIEAHGQHVFLGLQQAIPHLESVDERLPKSVIRLIFHPCIFSRTNSSTLSTSLRAAIKDEKKWLIGTKPEPNWPEISSSQFKIDDDKALFEYQAAARTIQNLIPNTNLYKPDWLHELSDALWLFTQTENTTNQHRTSLYEWNDAYYTLLAAVITQKNIAQAKCLISERILALPEQEFLDALSSFLMRLDILYIDHDAISAEHAVTIRTMIVDKLVETRGWQRLAGNTENSTEMHLLWAAQRVFFHVDTCYVSQNTIDKITPFIPVLQDCIGKGASYILALFTLNIVEIEFRKDHAPLILELIQGCLRFNINSKAFWIDQGQLDQRICRYLEQLQKSITDQEELVQLHKDIEGFLTMLIALGSSEAQFLNRNFLERIQS